MKNTNANAMREKFTAMMLDFFKEQGEDAGQVASNVINFPVVAEDGEEGWIEIKIVVPKSDDGFEKREDFKWAQEEKERKAKEKAEAKKKKIERDKERRRKIEEEREEKRKEREENEEAE